MVFNAAVTTNSLNLSIEEELQQNSPQLVVNIADFKSQDLENFVNISEEIERTKRERRSQRKRSRSRSNTILATMTREEIFETTNIDDDQFLQAMEHETTYETEKDRAELINSIGNLMKYFDEDVKVRDESLVKASPGKKSTGGKVATAVASLRNKCGLQASALVNTKTEAKEVKASNIQELKKKYERSMEAEATASSQAIEKGKNPKSTRKSKVKQMALLFNNKINSMIRNSSPTPRTPEPRSPSLHSLSSPTFSSTPKPKSTKVKAKLPSVKTKLPSPKPSPFFKRKPLSKTASISSLANSPLMNRKPLQKQSSTTCLVADNVFSQLSVKDKALLYNKFIADLTKHNPQFGKHAEVLKSNVNKEIQKGEVVIEKQNSVKHLRDSLEAKMSPNIPLTKTLQRFKNANSLDNSYKSKEYEDILPTDLTPNCLEDDALDFTHVSSLTVVLKSTPEQKKSVTKLRKKLKKKDVTFLDEVKVIEPSFKRTQSMIRSSFCVEPLAPPKKIRRFRHEGLAPKMFFQNLHLEKLFYHWLQEKNGVAFDITAADNKNNVIKIVPKNSSEQVLPAREVQEILQAALQNLESRQPEQFKKCDKENNAIVVIKNTLENENCLEKSVIEIELPLEDENRDVKSKQTEESDLGLTSLPKTTSEDSQTEFNILDASDSSQKPARKKKLRRTLSLRKDTSEAEKLKICSTDSDSDYKTKEIKFQSCTLPKAKKCSNYIKKLIPKPLKLQSAHLNNDNTTSDLDSSLIRQVNSPTKVKTAYTLTIMSSPSPYSESDFNDSEFAKTSLKDISRSWPSLLETDWDRHPGLLKDKSASAAFTDLTKTKLLQEQQHLLMESFIDQGFQTDSPLRINRKSENEISKSAQNPENSSTPYKTSNKQQAFTAQPGFEKYNTISPIKNNCSQQESAYITGILSEEDLSAEFEQERNRSPSSLNETTSYSSEIFLNTPSTYDLNFTHKVVHTSQFWITSGDFTAAIAIHHCDPDYPMIIRKLFAQQSFETEEINFGIDGQKFYLNRSATSDEITKQFLQGEDFSQYWFSNGDLIIPFRGPKMPNKKIQNFFNYIRGFMEETECLRLGIDSCELLCDSPGTQIASSPLKTSDLDQSDEELEEYDQSRLTFSSLASYQNSTSLNSDNCINNTPQKNANNMNSITDSLEQIVVDVVQLCLTDKPASETECKVTEIMKTLQTQQSAFKILEEHPKPNTIKQSPKHLSKIRKIFNTIEDVCRAMVSDNVIAITNI